MFGKDLKGGLGFIYPQAKQNEFRDEKARLAIHKRKSFTLAEILITLGIIGFVAVMTVPTLLQNSAKQQTVAKLQKVYTSLSQSRWRLMLQECLLTSGLRVM